MKLWRWTWNGVGLEILEDEMDISGKGKAMFNTGESEGFMSEKIEFGAIHVEPAFLYRR